MDVEPVQTNACKVSGYDNGDLYRQISAGRSGRGGYGLYEVS